MKFATKTIHAGIHPDPLTGAVMTPIYQTSTYAQESPGKHKGYEYARTQNPTRDVLQANLAALENGKFGYCFASGLAATDVMMKMLKPHDEVISTNDLYGGTYRIFRRVFEKYGIKFHFVDMTDQRQIEAAMNSNTRMIWIETPTNPLVRIVDIQAVTTLAKAKNVLTVVDNTFATPYCQTPLDLGADFVVHSATKYLNGHSDVIMGAIITNHEEYAQEIKFLQNACGAVPSPHDCFLVLRGVKTLHLRMAAHDQNGRKIAEYLSKHPKVDMVHYPGLPSHPQHEIAKKQMRIFGGMMSFTLKGDSLEESFRVMERLQLFTLAESLGGVESLCGHPASMTHGSIPREERLKSGLKDSLIRLSVGVEDVEDLIADLEQAIG